MRTTNTYSGRPLNGWSCHNPIVSLTEGEQALAYSLTSKERPFLILCALNMPLINGLGLRRRGNATEELHRKFILVVFLTTTASE